jgi:prepilin-type N-terminal cleavage/methylation domain-containing protein
MRHPRAGLTLIEVVVTLALLGVLFGLVAVSTVALEPTTEATIPRRIAAARREAVRTGVPVTLAFENGAQATLYPDGSATPARVADSAGTWRVDPWTGAVTRE